MSMTAYLIAVGSELLLPGREDTNTSFLRSRLFELGIPVEGVSVIGDDESSLVRLLEGVAKSCPIVVLTGGLGPTEDDITKKAVARFLKRNMRYDEKIQARLAEQFAARELKMPENNIRQALIPVGSRILENDRGTAPGLAIEDQQNLYILLPGPPAEMKSMFEAAAIPLLHKKTGALRTLQRRLRLTGIPESKADELAAPVYRKYPDIQTTILCKPGDIELIFTARGGSITQQAELDNLITGLQPVLGEYIYSYLGEDLELVIANLLKSRQLTLSTAESCTGGLLSKRLTDIPGSSGFFSGGIICYSNALKTGLLGVPAELIEKHGAVSSATATAMAAGICRKTSSDAGLAITGIAGPGGGTKEKPVGVVYIAAVVRDRLVVKKFHFHGDRARIRQQSAQTALEVLRRMVISPGGE